MVAADIAKPVVADQDIDVPAFIIGSRSYLARDSWTNPAWNRDAKGGDTKLPDKDSIWRRLDSKSQSEGPHVFGEGFCLETVASVYFCASKRPMPVDYICLCLHLKPNLNIFSRRRKQE